MSTIIGIIIIFINVIIRGQVPSRLLGHSWHRSKQSDVFTGTEVHHLDNEVGDDAVDYLFIHETDQTVKSIPIMMMPMTLMMKILQVISRLVLPYLGDEVTLLHLLKSTHLHQYWFHPGYHTYWVHPVTTQVHHTGWNACSSCHDDASRDRSRWKLNQWCWCSSLMCCGKIDDAPPHVNVLILILHTTQVDHARSGLRPCVCRWCEDGPSETKAWQGEKHR